MCHVVFQQKTKRPKGAKRDQMGLKWTKRAQNRVEGVIAHRDQDSV